MNISEIRQKFPQYNDLSDTDLANGFHSKFYSDVPRQEFFNSLGVQFSENQAEAKARLDQEELDDTGTIERFLIGAGRGFTTLAEGVKGLTLDAGNALGVVEDETVENFDQAVQEERQEFSESPVGGTTAAKVGELTAEIAPSLVVGGGIVGAATKGAQKVSQAASVGKTALQVAESTNRAAKIGKTAGVVGAGAIDGAVVSDTDNQLGGAAIGATAAGVLDKAVDGAQGLLKASRADRLLTQITPTVEKLKGEARQFYDAVKASGAGVTPRAYSSLLKNVEKNLKDEGFRPLQHPAINTALKDLKTEKGKAVTFSDLDNLRSALKDQTADFGSNSARLANVAVSQIDEFVNTINPKSIVGGDTQGLSLGFKEARSKWHTAKKAETIQELFKGAEVAASGVENGIRTKARQVYNNPKKRAYFNKEEQILLKSVANGTAKENILKNIGKFGISGGQQGQALLPIVGLAAGGLDVTIIASAAKHISEKGTEKRAKSFVRSILNKGDARGIANTYVNSVPRSQQSASQLAEIIKGSPEKSLVSLGRLARKRNNKHSKIILDAIGAVGASKASTTDQ